MYVSYSDESSYNQGRFRSIALVTLDVKDLAMANENLQNIIQSSHITEFKWSDLRTAKDKFAAIKIIKYIIEKVKQRKVRIDVLIWDISDKRHNIYGRDDNANFQRMYYHICSNVLGKRWTKGESWHLYPDDQSSMEWDSLKFYLNSGASTLDIEHPSLAQGSIKLRMGQKFHVQEIEPRQSYLEPLIQVADLFAGIGVYSHSEYKCFESWESNTQTKLSNSARERCQVLELLNNLCKEQKLGVSLRTDRGLRTRNPASPLNFWLYQPQHDADKAPLREVSNLKN